MGPYITLPSCQAAMEKLHSNQLLTAKEERGGDTIQTASLISSFEPTLSQLTAKWLPIDYLRGNHRNLIPLKVKSSTTENLIISFLMWWDIRAERAYLRQRPP